MIRGWDLRMRERKESLQTIDLDRLRHEIDEPLAEELLHIALDRLSRDRHGFERLGAGIDDTRLVEILRARSALNESLVYAHHVYAEVDHFCRRFHLEPRRVLEIGPGTNLGTLFCFRLAGAERAAGIDIVSAREPSMPFYTALARYLSCVEGFRWWRNFADRNVYPQADFPHSGDERDVESLVRSLEYRSGIRAEDLPYEDGSFDLVYSVAALEHVPEPGPTVSEIARVLRPGGLAVHEIGLIHHGSADPLRFLEWSDEEYAEKAEPYGEGRSLDGILEGSWVGEVFCNRIRRPDWLMHFRASGLLECVEEPLITLDRSLIRKERFASRFRAYDEDELAILAFRLVARKAQVP